MTKRAFWFGIVAWALAVPALGCDSGKSCQTLCEEANACPNVTVPEDDCAQACTDRDKLNTAAACSSKQQDYDECAGRLPDICAASEQCVTEALTIFDCIDDYCSANPGECGGS